MKLLVAEDEAHLRHPQSESDHQVEALFPSTSRTVTMTCYGALHMIGSLRLHLTLAVTLMTVLSIILLMPLTGNVLGCLAIVALAAFIITL
ncbi:hypothetical protein [Pseudomonas sp. RT6P73]